MPFKYLARVDKNQLICFKATAHLSLLTMLADSSLLEILFSGLDGPPLDMALKLPVILDWPLQPSVADDMENGLWNERNVQIYSLRNGLSVPITHANSLTYLVVIGSKMSFKNQSMPCVSIAWTETKSPKIYQMNEHKKQKMQKRFHK